MTIRLVKFTGSLSEEWISPLSMGLLSSSENTLLKLLGRFDLIFLWGFPKVFTKVNNISFVRCCLHVFSCNALYISFPRQGNNSVWWGCFKNIKLWPRKAEKQIIPPSPHFMGKKMFLGRKRKLVRIVPLTNFSPKMYFKIHSIIWMKKFFQ